MRRWLAVAFVAGLVGCTSDGVDEAARDECEDEYGVGNCVEREGAWVPLASATSTTERDTTSSSSESTTTTTIATTTTVARQTLTGTMKVGHDGWLVKNDNCANGSFDGYSDMHVGASVTVKDAAGAIVATGRVERAEWVNRQNKSDEFGTYETAGCLLHWSVASVPITGDFLSVNVGSERRGFVNFSVPELSAAGWVVRLSI